MMATPVKKWLLRVAPCFLPVGIVAVWQLASSVGWLSTRILPSPEGVVTAFWCLRQRRTVAVDWPPESPDNQYHLFK